MQYAKTLPILLILVIGIAGCAERRSRCKCRCLGAQRFAPHACGQVSACDTTPGCDDIQPAPQPAESPKVENSSIFKGANTLENSEPIVEAVVLPVTFAKVKNETNKPVTEFRPVIREIDDEANNENEGLFAHAPDYSWLKGRLQKVHVPGVEWKIRYLPIDKVDPWGGSMILAADIRLEDFGDQDMVFIEGEIVHDRPSVYLNGPLYRISEIRLQKSEPDHFSN